MRSIAAALLSLLLAARVFHTAAWAMSRGLPISTRPVRPELRGAAGAVCAMNAGGEDRVSISRRDLGVLCSAGLASLQIGAASAAGRGEDGAAQPQPKFIKTESGLKYYDVTVGGGPLVSKGCKVNFNFKGRLAGRNGKPFEDTFGGEPFRATLGQGTLIQGLEEGLVGMREGGARRILVPSLLGYTDKTVGPVPRDFGMRNRLYSTVFNKERTVKEREALGADIAGVILADVQILRVFCDAAE